MNQEHKQFTTIPSLVELTTQKKYDPFTRPPNLSIAKQHGEATKYGDVITFQGEEIEKCPCCGFPTNVNNIGIFCDRKSLCQEGPGIPLYFDFILFCIFILTIYGLLVGIYNINLNSLGQRCQYENSHQVVDLCVDNFYNNFSLSNRRGVVDQIGSLLNFLASIIIMVITLMYRKMIQQISSNIDESQITVSDYSIIVQNIPEDATDNEILEFFIKENSKFSIIPEIRKLSLSYDITKYLEIQKQYQQKQFHLTKLLDTENSVQSSIQKLNDLKDELKQSQGELHLREKDLTKSKFSGVCFITYNTHKQSVVMRKYFSKTKYQFFSNIQNKFRQRVITVDRAPEPGDILWQNLGISHFKKIKKRICTALASIITLSISFVIIFGISFVEGKYITTEQNSDHPTLEKLGIISLGFFASLLVSVINQILVAVIRELAIYERHNTQTQLNISIAKKLGIAQFLNTAIITLLVNVIFQQLQSEQTLQFSHQIWKEGGLNYHLNLILITDALFTWVQLILNPFWLINLYKRRQIINLGDKCTLTQQEANIIFQGSQFNLEQKYAHIAKTIMLTFFYAYLLPIGVAISIISLIFLYWIEKIILLRRDQKPAPTGDELAKEMINFFMEIVMILFATGCCLWEHYIFDEIYTLTKAQLGISFFYFILPMKEIQEKCFKEEQIVINEPYDEVKNVFWDDYDRRNPLTMQKALEQWMNRHVIGLSDTQLNSPFTDQAISSKIIPPPKYIQPFSIQDQPHQQTLVVESYEINLTGQQQIQEQIHPFIQPDGYFNYYQDQQFNQFELQQEQYLQQPQQQYYQQIQLQQPSQQQTQQIYQQQQQKYPLNKNNFIQQSNKQAFQANSSPISQIPIEIKPKFIHQSNYIELSQPYFITNQQVKEQNLFFIQQNFFYDHQEEQNEKQAHD